MSSPDSMKSEPSVLAHDIETISEEFIAYVASPFLRLQRALFIAKEIHITTPLLQNSPLFNDIAFVVKFANGEIDTSAEENLMELPEAILTIVGLVSVAPYSPSYC